MKQSKKILVFQHEFREHPSRLNQYALENNIELDVVRLWEPYEMPDPSGYDALIIFGGSKGVYDDFPSKEAELQILRDSMDTMPVLGICLGAQLIASALGANVAKMHDGKEHKREIGFSTVGLTKAGEQSPFFKGFDSKFVVSQIHQDMFDVPDGAELLATGPHCPNQAFSYGKKTLGIQFHLEYTPYALAHLFDVNKHWLNEPYATAEKRLSEESFRHAPAIERQFNLLMDNFLSV